MPGEVSIASTLVLYSFVIAAGIYIGKVKFFGVSLGVTFVLFVGILMGHFGYVSTTTSSSSCVSSASFCSSFQ